MAKLTKEQVEKLVKDFTSGVAEFDLPETRDIEGVEIFAAGRWNGDVYTEKDIDEMVENFNATSQFVKPYLKLGHDDNQKLLQRDGLPAAGWVSNLRKVGTKLVADFKNLPKKIYDLISSGAYRRVSSEIYMGFEAAGKKYGKVLKAVSLLGGDTPAVQTLDDIIALYASNGEVKVFDGNTQSKTYELQTSELNKGEENNMKTVEQLTAELADTQKKLVEAESKVKELTEKSGKDAEQIKTLTDEKAALDKTNKELSVSVEKFTAEAEKSKAEAAVDKLIREKNIAPAQKEEVFALLCESLKTSADKKFKIKEKVEGKDSEKEVSHFDFIVATFAKGNISVNTSQKTNAGERQGDDDVTHQKAMKYIEEAKKEGRTVSYKEAVVAVSSADTKADGE